MYGCKLLAREPDTMSFGRQLIAILLMALLGACSDDGPVPPERYVESDAMMESIRANVAAANDLVEVVEIDHSRLGHEAGSPMPPARALIFSSPRLESRLIALNPLVALELPLRVLAYEAHPGERSRVIYNRFDYLRSRYGLSGEGLESLGQEYQQAFDQVLQGVDPGALADFAENQMQPDGIITIASPFDFEETLARVNAAIDAQSDTVRFGAVDFQAAAAKYDIELQRSHMILFGGPGPGGKAMADAVTLGLDAFCQKFLVWEDEQGRVFLSFNDLLALAERQDVPKRLPLRVINFRLNSVFAEALAEQ